MLQTVELIQFVDFSFCLCGRWGKCDSFDQCAWNEISLKNGKLKEDRANNNENRTKMRMREKIENKAKLGKSENSWKVKSIKTMRQFNLKLIDTELFVYFTAARVHFCCFFSPFFAFVGCLDFGLFFVCIFYFTFSRLPFANDWKHKVWPDECIVYLSRCTCVYVMA